MLVWETARRIDPADHVLQFDLGHHHAGKVAQHLTLIGFEIARLRVDHA